MDVGSVVGDLHSGVVGGSGAGGAGVADGAVGVEGGGAVWWEPVVMVVVSGSPSGSLVIGG